MSHLQKSKRTKIILVLSSFATECLIGTLQENQKCIYKPYNYFQMAGAIISLRKPIMSSLCYYSNRCKISIMLGTTLGSIQRQLSKVTSGLGTNCALKEKGKACSLCHKVRNTLEMMFLYCDNKFQNYGSAFMWFWKSASWSSSVHNGGMQTS